VKLTAASAVPHTGPIPGFATMTQNLTSPATADNLPILSVSEVAGALKATIEGAFPLVRVRGEISGFKRAASGHIYFALKDSEAVLNAVTHRDYADPGEVLIRHAPRELALTSPGGFVGGIRVDNILRHEPVARNRTLANAFLKLRLVEAAGTGRRRIFVPMLSYGKRIPEYESDGQRVTLRIYDGVFDRALAQMVAKWNAGGREIQLDALLVLAYMKEHPYIDAKRAAGLLQLEREDARGVLDQLSVPRKGILERRGRTQAATFHLAKGIAKDLLGRAAYTRTKGIAPARFAEIVREYVHDHGSITNRECRELLGLGDSPSAQVEASRYLKKWSASNGFLNAEGKRPRVKYRPRTLLGNVLSKLRGL